MIDWNAVSGGIISATFALSLLAAVLVLFGGRYKLALLPLVGFFIGNALTELSDVMIFITNDAYPEWTELLLDMFAMLGNLALAPMLWLYIRGLTSESYPEFTRKDLWHGLPFVIGCGLVLFVYLTPPEVRNTVLGDQDVEIGLYGLLLILYLLFVIAMFYVQAGVYIFVVLFRLTAYRSRLKDVFASTENRELRWISIVGLALVSAWLHSATTTALDMFTDYDLGFDIPSSVANLILTVTLAIWGLRQKPGFEPVVHKRERLVEEDVTPKYERSALSPEQSEKIAGKIKKAMEHDQLYRDPNLSLWMLSKHISVTSNYVSQTLNMTIGETFFDYVNSWRVEDAKRLVAEDRETVLAIAYDVGFNSRSSFYTAFKRETGMTPTQYKQKSAVQA